MNSTLVYFITYLLLSGLLIAMPYLIVPNIPFGVRVPQSYVDDPVVIVERKKYLWRMVILTLALAVTSFIIYSLTGWQGVHPFYLIGLILGGWVVYYISHRHLAQVKQAEGWYANTRQTLIASVTPRSSKPAKVFFVLTVLCALTILVTLVIAFWQMPQLSQQIVYRFPNSLGTWNLETSLFSVSLPVLIQVGLTALIGLLAWYCRVNGEMLDVENPEGSRLYQNFNLDMVQGLLMMLALGIDCSLLLAGLAGWGLVKNTSGVSDLFVLIPMALWLTAIPVALLGFRNKYSTLKVSPTEQKDEEKKVSRDDDPYWKLGVIYFNREGPSILVNKRFGIGRTLNFGNPIAWILIVLLFGFIAYKIIVKG